MLFILIEKMKFCGVGGLIMGIFVSYSESKLFIWSALGEGGFKAYWNEHSELVSLHEEVEWIYQWQFDGLKKELIFPPMFFILFI